MLGNIQALRFLAALAVVYYHTGYGIFGVETEFGAVPVFFCISGFIMTMISRQNADAFMRRRIIRIVPLYWILTAAYWALITLPGGLPRILATSPESVVKSLLFIPYMNSAGHLQPILNVGWTLNFEMYFYAIFAGCLLINRTLAPAMCGIAICVIAMLAGLSDSEVIRFYSDFHVFYFVAGIALFYVLPVIRVVPGLSVIAVVLVVAYPLQGFAYPPTPFAPVAIVLAALVLEKQGIALKDRWALMLGAASYAIYLGHFIVLHTYRMGTLKLGLPSFETNLLVALLVTAVSVAVGSILHSRIEIPMTSKLRSLTEDHKIDVRRVTSGG